MVDLLNANATDALNQGSHWRATFTVGDGGVSGWAEGFLFSGSVFGDLYDTLAEGGKAYPVSPRPDTSGEAQGSAVTIDVRVAIGSGLFHVSDLIAYLDGAKAATNLRTLQNIDAAGSLNPQSAAVARTTSTQSVVDKDKASNPITQLGGALKWVVVGGGLLLGLGAVLYFGPEIKAALSKLKGRK